MSALCGWGIAAPTRFGMVLGEALQFVGPDRIVWGTDNFGSEARVRLAVQGFSGFQIPEELQRGYGFPELSEEDSRKIFGLNMAKLLKINPVKRA